MQISPEEVAGISSPGSLKLPVRVSRNLLERNRHFTLLSWALFRALQLAVTVNANEMCEHWQASWTRGPICGRRPGPRKGPFGRSLNHEWICGPLSPTTTTREEREREREREREGGRVHNGTLKGGRKRRRKGSRPHSCLLFGT